MENVIGFTGGGQRNSGADVHLSSNPSRSASCRSTWSWPGCAASSRKEPGANLYLQPVQDIRIGGRQSNALYQYTLQADDLSELRAWEPRIRRALSELPELVDVNTDQQDKGLQTSLIIDRDTASRLGVTPNLIDSTLNDLFGQRQVSTIYNPLNQYRVVMEAAPEYWQSPEILKDVYVSTSSGSQVPLSAFASYGPTNTPLAVNHQGQFAASTISFNLPPGVSLSDATRAVADALDRIGVPTSIHGSFQGTARAFQSSLDSQPWLILTALLTVYIVLGILYESYVHPITILSTLPSAGVGALLALLICRTEFSIIALIGVILADRDRQEERHHDDRLRTRGGAHAGLAARRGDLPGLPAALPPDHDDHHGRAARRGAARDRRGRWRRAAPPAGHLHRRRPDREPDADPVHDAGGLLYLDRFGSWSKRVWANRGARPASNPAQ